MPAQNTANRGKRTGNRPTSTGRQSNGGDDDEDGQYGDSDQADFLRMANNVLTRAGNNADNQAGEIARLYADLFAARKKKNFYKSRVAELEDELPEDAVVLTGPEADAIKAIRDRKLDLGKLHTLIESLENDKATLSVENAQFKAKDLYHEFVKSSGYNVDAVGGLVASEKLHAELGDVTVDTVDATGKKTGSKTTKTLKVRKTSDPKAPLVPFDAYVEQHVKYMWPALRAKADGATAASGGAVASQTNSTLVVDQGGGGTQAGTNPVQEFKKQQAAARAAQANPLDFGAHTNSASQGGRRGVPIK